MEPTLCSKVLTRGAKIVLRELIRVIEVNARVGTREATRGAVVVLERVLEWRLVKPWLSGSVDFG